MMMMRAIACSLLLAACGGAEFSEVLFDDAGDAAIDVGDELAGDAGVDDVVGDTSALDAELGDAKREGSVDAGAGDTSVDAAPDALGLCCKVDGGTLHACGAGTFGCYPDAGTIAQLCTTANVCTAGGRCVLVDGVTFGSVAACP